MKKIATIYFIAILSVTSVLSQSNTSRWGLSYAISVPSGRFSDFIADESYRGWIFDYQNFRSENFSVGFATGWRIFNQTREKNTFDFEVGNTIGAVNTKTWSYTHEVPFQITGRYYPNGTDGIQPFIGAGLGGTYLRQEVWAGQAEFVSNDFAFSFYPEAGLNIELSESLVLQLATQFNHTVNSNFDDKSLSFWSFKIGINGANL